MIMKVFKSSKKYNNFYPIAALTNIELDKIVDEISYISKIGFKAIKIHQRLLNKNFSYKELATIFNFCIEKDIIVFSVPTIFQK